MVVNYLLISDGSSDAALIPIIQHVLQNTFRNFSFIGERAQLFRLKRPPKTLSDKIKAGVDLYNPDIVFIHRDCENDTILKREEEILEAIKDQPDLKVVKIIPLRMTEAWLLINESAIRMAVSNPNGKVKLAMPSVNKLERLPDPKNTLEDLLRIASELKGRRLDSLNTRKAIHLVANHIDDFSTLYQLEAFNHLRNQIESLVLEKN
jgi:hypothetical protein